MNIAKFLRTPIFKNICERLPLKISTSVTNLPKEGNSLILYPFKPYYPKFFYDRMAFYVTCFAKIFMLLLLHNTHQVRFIISSSLRLLLKV